MVIISSVLREDENRFLKSLVCLYVDNILRLHTGLVKSKIFILEVLNELKKSFYLCSWIFLFYNSSKIKRYLTQQRFFAPIAACFFGTKRNQFSI